MDDVGGDNLRRLSPHRAGLGAGGQPTRDLAPEDAPGLPPETPRWDGPLVKAFVHIRRSDARLWDNLYHGFTRMPCVGEYFTLHTTGEWCRVRLVLHTPWAWADVDGEVYAEPVDHLEELRQAFPADRGE